jgi:hypothetical protein
MLNYGAGIGATGGVQDATLADLMQCWNQQADSDSDGQADTIWPLMLPVIDCPENNVSNCAELLGAVYVNVVWIEEKANDYRDAPRKMEDWDASTDSTLVEDLSEFYEPQGPQDEFPVFPTGTTVAAVVAADVAAGNDTIECGKVRWASFVGHFNLQNADGNYATFDKKSLYFLPDCSPHELVGTSQGENFGVLARIPVLVD